MTTLFRIRLDFVFTAQKKRKRAKGWQIFLCYNSVCIFIDFNSMNHRPPTAFCPLVMGGWCSSYVLFRPFFFTVSWLYVILLFLLCTPQVTYKRLPQYIDCLMCYEWALKITNSTVPTFLKSIISIKSIFMLFPYIKITITKSGPP